MQLVEHRQHVDLLRHMLAELMVKQSSVTLTTEQRRLYKEGIKALQAAVVAMDLQIFA